MKTYVVTGVSSGIGAAVTEQLLARGHRVIGLGRRSFESSESDGFRFVEVDFTDRESTDKVLWSLRKLSNEIDGVISNAGIGLFGQLESHRSHDVFQTIDVNLTAHILLARALLPMMKKAGRGTFIFMGSEAGHQGRRNGSVYCATKAALKAFAQALRQDVASRGVRVSIINPGMVDTPFFSELPFRPGDEQGQHLTAQQVAASVCTLLDAPIGVVIDELSLSPQVNVVKFDPDKKV